MLIPKQHFGIAADIYRMSFREIFYQASVVLLMYNKEGHRKLKAVVALQVGEEDVLP